MPIVASRFKPAWWLPSPHLQTLWPVLWRSRTGPSLTWERMATPDGDFLDLAWAGNADNPLVLVLHGLEGSLRSHYAAGLLPRLVNAGFRVVFLHFRGCSGEPNRLARSYHSGDTGDLRAVLDHIRKTRNADVFAAVGFSLGGNVLLKWLGEEADGARVKAAIAVSVPFRLKDAALRLERGLSRIYQRHLIARLQAKYRAKFSDRESPLRVDLAKLKTFSLFDDQVTAPLHGFAGVEDYYRRSSCLPYLKTIRRATLILHSLDDPFMWPATIPSADDLAPLVTLELTAKGGHVGFVTGRLPWQPIYWHEQRILNFLQNWGQRKNSLNH